MPFQQSLVLRGCRVSECQKHMEQKQKGEQNAAHILQFRAERPTQARRVDVYGHTGAELHRCSAEAFIVSVTALFC